MGAEIVRLIGFIRKNRKKKKPNITSWNAFRKKTIPDYTKRLALMTTALMKIHNFASLSKNHKLTRLVSKLKVVQISRTRNGLFVIANNSIYVNTPKGDITPMDRPTCDTTRPPVNVTSGNGKSKRTSTKYCVRSSVTQAYAGLYTLPIAQVFPRIIGFAVSWLEPGATERESELVTKRDRIMIFEENPVGPLKGPAHLYGQMSACPSRALPSGARSNV